GGDCRRPTAGSARDDAIYGWIWPMALSMVRIYPTYKHTCCDKQLSRGNPAAGFCARTRTNRLVMTAGEKAGRAWLNELRRGELLRRGPPPLPQNKAAVRAR